jgi:hypothetical protein
MTDIERSYAMASYVGDSQQSFDGTAVTVTWTEDINDDETLYTMSSGELTVSRDADVVVHVTMTLGTESSAAFDAKVVVEIDSSPVTSGTFYAGAS